MKRLLALLALVVFLWPAATQAAVALCAISGQVFNPDGTTLNNGTVQFNSQVTQVVGSTTIPPSIISTTTDANGNMAPMSVAQGLFGTFTFCQGHSSTNVGGPGGGCAAPINGLIPINTTGNIQSVIAGTLLPSVGNATVNNLTATSNINVGGQTQTQTLLVNGNSTLSGTLNVTGNTTLTGTLTTGAMTAPALTLTQTTCSALNLAEASIYSAPPNNNFTLMVGAHCSGSSFIADESSAVLFSNWYNPTGSISNAGWQWLGDQGLTPSSTYTPTVRMTLSDAGTLTLPITGTPIQLAGGSVSSVSNPNVAINSGAHYSGGTWIADSTANAGISLGGTGSNPGIGFYLTANTTPGSSYTSTNIANLTLNGLALTGTNPVAILQSNTNANADILQVLPQNGTIGIGLTYQSIHSIGSNANNNLLLDAKGTGYIGLNTINAGSTIYANGNMIIQSNYHLVSTNNGVLPTLGTCSAGTLNSLSTDNVGQVNFTGAGAGSCGVNFSRAFSPYPLCVCSSAPSVGAPGSCIASVGASSATFYFNTAMTSNGYFDYHCTGVQ